MPSETAAAPSLDDFLEQPKRSFWARHARWIGFGIVGLLALGALGRCVRGPTPVAYQFGEVIQRDVAVTVTATGNLAPTNQIDIGSEISGIVEKVMVDVNDRVSKGQALAVIDTSRLDDAARRSNASLAASDAGLNQAKATLAEAEAQLMRLQEVARLSNGRVPSESEMTAQVAATQRARAAYASSAANVAAARAQLSSDQTQLAKAVIRAPVSGVVLRRMVDPGQTVQAAFNTPSLFIVGEDLTRMKLEVAVDEADIGRVQSGMSATFAVDAYPGEAFPAQVARVDLGARSLGGGQQSSTSGQVVSYMATLSLDNSAMRLRPGMTATATIASETARDALTVPNAALRFSPATAGEKRANSFTIRPPTGDTGKTAQAREIGVGSRQTVYVVGDRDALTPVAVVTGVTDGRVTVVYLTDAGDSQKLRPGTRVATGLRAAQK
jgi:HlyD family secretion protein